MNPSSNIQDVSTDVSKEMGNASDDNNKGLLRVIPEEDEKMQEGIDFNEEEDGVTLRRGGKNGENDTGLLKDIVSGDRLSKLTERPNTLMPNINHYNLDINTSSNLH